MDSEAIKRKYKTSANFKKQMEKADEYYTILSQRAYYSGMSPGAIDFMTRLSGTSSKGPDILFVYAALQHARAPTLDRLALGFITGLPQPKRPYILVYFNDEDNSDAFSQFKRMLELMPFAYYANMDKIVLMRPIFTQKAGRFFGFGTITKFINEKIVYAEELGELAAEIRLKVVDITNNLPKDLTKEYKITKNMIRSERMQEELEAPMIIRKTKTEQAYKPKHEVTDYQLSDNGIPVPFQVLIYYFREHPQLLNEEGIFRKSASIEQTDEVELSMSKKYYNHLERVTNPHIVANLVKRFLNGLATPLIPFPLFHALMEAQTLTPQLLHGVLKQLQSLNLTKLLTLIFLVQFLKQSVVPLASHNKMTSLNISVCFAPTLMWAQVPSLRDIEYTKKSVRVVNIMIDNFEEVFGNKKEQKKLYRCSYLSSRKKSLIEVLSPGDNDKLSLEGNQSVHSKDQPLFQKTESQVDPLSSDDDEQQQQQNLKHNRVKLKQQANQEKSEEIPEQQPLTHKHLPKQSLLALKHEELRDTQKRGLLPPS